MLIPYQVMLIWFKALEEQLVFYLVKLYSTSMMLFIMLILAKIFLVSRIIAEMDIILKLRIMVVMNIFSLLWLFLEKNISWKNFILTHVGYIRQLSDQMDHMLSWTKSSMTKNFLCFGMNALVIQDSLWFIVS